VADRQRFGHRSGRHRRLSMLSACAGRDAPVPVFGFAGVYPNEFNRHAAELGPKSRCNGSGKMIDFKRALVMSAAAVAFSAGNAPSALAQDDPRATQVAQAIEEIVVTARKREESLQDAPLSISAFSESAIDQLGVRNLQDIAKFTPGLSFQSQGTQVPGRYNSAVRFRGMFSEAARATQQLASVFIDGVFVSSGISSLGLEDVERVEIIKGPQSALFGRTTFGGAVNFITKKPSLEEYGGKLTASITDRRQFEATASVNGPLIKDRLAFGLSGRYYDKRGHYTSVTDGGRLGSEQTKSISGQLYATPAEGLELRFRANYFEDNDGPPASVFFPARLPEFGRLCTPTATRPFICGALPDLQDRYINLNTQLPEFVRNVLVNNSGNRPALRNTLRPDEQELVRESWRMSLSLDWEIPNTAFTLSTITGLSQEKANWIRDFDQFSTPFWFSADPQYHRIFSQEARIAYDNDGAFRALVGGNYIRQRFLNNGTGGVSTLPPGAPSVPPAGFISGGQQAYDRPNTKGIFGQVSYDFLEVFTASFEGRYQWDKIRTFAVAGQPPLEGKFKKFLPRAILQYKPTDDTNIYAVWSKGNNPGAVTADIATANANVRQQIATITGITDELVPEENITNYEVGVKQGFWDGRAQVNASGYLMKWKNQRSNVVAVVIDPGHPSAIFDPVRNAFTRTLNITLPIGETDLWGVELDATVIPVEGWEVRGTFNWAASEYKKFPNAGFATPIAGVNDLSGRETPRFPEFSGTISTNYTQSFSSTWDWFVGGEAIYTGKTWADQANLSYTKAYWTFNLRAGLERENLRLEAFVTNLTNEDQYPAAYRFTDFSVGLVINTALQGVTASLPDKRQFGLRATLNF
jgi:iron complex outermembrane receptor protein